jgi:hypothetical protein
MAGRGYRSPPAGAGSRYHTVGVDWGVTGSACGWRPVRISRHHANREVGHALVVR